MRGQFYNVFLNGKVIDCVYYIGYTCEEVRTSLINHDGYNSAISVKVK